VPDQAEWLRTLATFANRLESLGRRFLEDRFQRVDWLSRRLSQSSPAATVVRQKQWLNNLQQVMIAAMRHDISTQARQLAAVEARLRDHSPALDVQRSIRRLSSARQNLLSAGTNALERRKAQLKLAARALNAVSPLATLDRGYAIVISDATGRVLTDASEAPAGSKIRARLATGEIKATIDQSSGVSIE
jgi:exodeoxyribonuclease VII large subunit